jgi:hypothetical protein
VAKRDDDLEVGRAGFIEHALFPLEEGIKPFEVSYISIARKEGGAMVWVPQMFRAEELTSTDQILERFGGGTYELYARSQSRTNAGQAGSITKRRLVTLPGKPKPLDPSNATAQEEIAAGIRPSPFDAPKTGLGALGSDGVLVAILQMNQQASQMAAQQAAAAAAAQAQQSQQFMGLMMQMISEGKKESAQSMQMMMQMMTTMTQAQQQSMMQMLPLLVTTKGGGPEELDKYLALFQKLGLAKAGAPSEDAGDADDSVSVTEVLSNVASIVQGAPAALSALKEMGPGGMAPGNGQVALPVGEAQPGSAASVLQGRG